MNNLDDLLLQREAAEYLEVEWDIPISTQDLSKLARYGVGPDFRPKGRSKLFTKLALDSFAENYWRNKRNSDNECAAERSA